MDLEDLEREAHELPDWAEQELPGSETAGADGSQLGEPGRFRLAPLPGGTDPCDRAETTDGTSPHEKAERIVEMVAMEEPEDPGTETSSNNSMTRAKI